MSDLKIKVIAVNVSTKVTKTNKEYIEVEVTYKNLSFQEKVESKKVNPFGSKAVYDTLKNSQAGDIYNIQRVKEGEYWQWVDISLGEASSVASTTVPVKDAGRSFTSPKSTYETPEERAKRQVLIVRQSSLSNAIDVLKTDKKVPTKEEVTELAEYFYDWVFENDKKPIKLANLPPTDLEDDIPE